MLVPNIHVKDTDVLVRLMKWRSSHVSNPSGWITSTVATTVNVSEKWEDPSSALREARIVDYTNDHKYVQLLLMPTISRLSGDQGLEHVWLPVDEVIVKYTFPTAHSKPKPKKAKR